MWLRLPTLVDLTPIFYPSNIYTFTLVRSLFLSFSPVLHLIFFSSLSSEAFEVCLVIGVLYCFIVSVDFLLVLPYLCHCCIYNPCNWILCKTKQLISPYDSELIGYNIGSSDLHLQTMDAAKTLISHKKRGF